jgi:hypothetical protein
MGGNLETLSRQRLRVHRRAALALSMIVVLASAFGLPLLAHSSSADAAALHTLPYGSGRFMAVDPNGGYWTTTWLGDLVTHNGAGQFGSPAASNIHLQKPIVGMAATPTGNGYWMVATDGGVFSYGGAHFYGSTGSMHLNQPIVGLAATPDGNGYWLVASDGGIFAYGDARFYGSTGSIHLNQPIVGMEATPDGNGYWLVASDGGIFAYGDAQFYGSTGSIHLNQPIIAMAATPDNGGYWMVAADGGIFSFGDAPFYGSLGGTGLGAYGIIVSPTGEYSIVTTSGDMHTFTANTTSSMTTGPSSAAIQGGSPGSDCAPTTTPTAAPDASLDSLFANQIGPGWIGGDATYSTALPNGQEAFAFSDTLIGQAQPNGSAQVKGMPHNSELAGSLNDLHSDYSGSYGAASAVVPDAGNDSWEVAGTYMENGQELIFVNEFAPNPPSVYDVYTGRSAIAVMSLGTGTPTFSYLVSVPADAATEWGNAVMQAYDGYDYIYGANVTPSTFYGMKIARVPTGQSLNINAWTYWDGSQWVAGEGNAHPVQPYTVLTGVIPMANGSGYMAVSIPGGTVNDTTVNLLFACSPTGPWSSARAVYAIPELLEYPNEIAYIPTFHPELSGGSGLVISYDINTTNGMSTLQNNVHAYQPHFLTLSG